MSLTPEVQCHGLPEEFAIFLKKALELSFEEKPYYDTYRKMFNNLYLRMEYNN